MITCVRTCICCVCVFTCARFYDFLNPDFVVSLSMACCSRLCTSILIGLQEEGRSSSFRKARDTIISGGSATSVPDALASGSGRFILFIMSSNFYKIKNTNGRRFDICSLRKYCVDIWLCLLFLLQRVGFCCDFT